MITKEALDKLEKRYRKRIRNMHNEMNRVMNQVPKSTWSDVAPNFWRYISKEETKLYWIQNRKKKHVS